MLQSVHPLPLSIFFCGVVKISHDSDSAACLDQVEVTIVECVRPGGDWLGLVEVIKYFLLCLTDSITL